MNMNYNNVYYYVTMANYKVIYYAVIYTHAINHLLFIRYQCE